MYEFKHLKTSYDIDITLKHGGLTGMRYQGREHLTAQYRKEEDCYLFRLEEREQVLINGQPPRGIMDCLMAEMGNALYPLNLSVSTSGKILQVVNYGKVREQWLKTTQKILREQYTLPLARYIEISSRNLKSEEALRKSLEKNTFIKLFFLPSDTGLFTFAFDSFPDKNDLVVYQCLKEKNNEPDDNRYYTAGLIIPSGREGGGQIRYRLSGLGDPLRVEAGFSVADPDGNLAEKLIEIRTSESMRNVSGKKSDRSNMD